MADDVKMNENSHINNIDEDQSSLVTLVDLALALAVEPNKDHTYASSTTNNLSGDINLRSERESFNAVSDTSQLRCFHRDDRDHTYACRKTQNSRGRRQCSCVPVISQQNSRKSSSAENLNYAHEWPQVNIPKICDKKSNSLEKMHQQSSEFLGKDFAQMTVLSRSLPDSAGIFFLGNIEKISTPNEMLAQVCENESTPQLDMDRQCDHTYARAKAFKEKRESEQFLPAPADSEHTFNKPCISNDHNYGKTSSINEKRNPFKQVPGLRSMSHMSLDHQVEQDLCNIMDHNYILKNNLSNVSHSPDSESVCRSPDETLQAPGLSAVINNVNSGENLYVVPSQKETVSNWVQFCKDHTYSTLS